MYFTIVEKKTQNIKKICPQGPRRKETDAGNDAPKILLSSTVLLTFLGWEAESSTPEDLRINHSLCLAYESRWQLQTLQTLVLGSQKRMCLKWLKHVETPYWGAARR